MYSCYFGELHTDLLPLKGTVMRDRKTERYLEIVVQSVTALSFLMGECDRLWTDEGEISARTVSKCDIRDFNRVADSGTLL